MRTNVRRRVALAAVLVVIALVALWLFTRHRESTHADQSHGPGSAGATIAVEGTSASQVRLDKIRKLAHARSAELPKLTLTGKVVDADNQPVAGAEVLLATLHRTKTSAADGTFAFEELPPGPYEIEARKESRIGGPMRVRLTATSKPIVLRLYRALTAEILVVSAVDGKPIAGADVWMRMASMYEPAGNHTGRTGADGKVSFPGVQIAGHDLIVSARGYAGAVLGPEVLSREGDFWRVRVALVPGDGVEGIVVDDKGKPIEGAMLEAVPYAGESANAPEDETAIAKEAGTADPHVIRRRRVGPTTGPDGTFWLSLPDEERQQWTIVASHPNYQSMASEPIFKSGKAQVHKLTLTMQKGVHAAGWVVTGDDEPVAGATIQIRWQASGAAFLEKTIQADGRGHFDIVGLPPAPMALIALADDATSPPLRIDFSQPSPDQQELVLVLENNGIIDGVVVDAHDKPLPDIAVSWIELGHDEDHIRVLPSATNTDEEGRFAIRGVMPGAKYHISAVRPQNGDFVVHEGWVDARAGDNVRIRIPDGGSIVGRAILDGGRSPAGVTVVDRNTFATTSVQANGRFKLDNLPPGPYELDFSGAGVPHTYFKGVIVQEGKETDVGDVQLHGGRAVSGTLVTMAGQPIDGEVRVLVDGRYRVQLFANHNGRFKITVPASVALVVTAKNPSAGDAKPIAVSPNGTSENLRVVLEPGGTIHGKAIANGEPMVNLVVAAFRSGPRPAEPSAYAQIDAAGGYQLDHIAPGAYDVELVFPSEPGHDVRVYRKTVKVETGASVELDFDGSQGVAGGVPQPPAAEGDIPVYELPNEAS